jgi:hypothetical protein
MNSRVSQITSASSFEAIHDDGLTYHQLEEGSNLTKDFYHHTSTITTQTAAATTKDPSVSVSSTWFVVPSS